MHYKSEQYYKPHMTLSIMQESPDQIDAFDQVLACHDANGLAELLKDRAQKRPQLAYVEPDVIALLKDLPNFVQLDGMLSHISMAHWGEKMDGGYKLGLCSESGYFVGKDFRSPCGIDLTIGKQFHSQADFEQAMTRVKRYGDTGHRYRASFIGENAVVDLHKQSKLYATLEAFIGGQERI
jgi:hypothetical protein